MRSSLLKPLKASCSLPARPFSSTSRQSFSFFNKPSPPTAAKILDDLDAARSAERLDLVQRLYPSLVQTLANDQSTLARDRHAQFQQLMAFVASTSRLSLLLKMFSDLPTLGFAQTSYDHHLLLTGLARSGKPNRALSWIEGMEETYGIAPSVREWNVVLGAYRKEKDVEGLRTVMARMLERGYSPNVATYNTLIAALFQQGLVQDARQVRAEMDTAGIQADVWTETTLLSGFVEAGELASAKDVYARLSPVVESWELDRPKNFDLAAVNALAKYACATDGFGSGVGLIEGYRDRGFVLNDITLTTLAKEGARGLSDAESAIDLVERLGKSTGVVAGRKAWSIVINGVLAGLGGIDEALKVLQEARDRSVKPDSAMIQPLLSALVTRPTPETFATAKLLYEDLATSSRAYSSAPDTSIYVTLLRACADPIHPDLEFSKTLLADMRERAVRLDAQSVTWHIVALMRVARDFADAFQSYDKVRALDAHVLTTSAYNIIITAFTSLTFPTATSPDAQIAPPPLILEFLSDMRRTSHPPDAITYSLLLTYYSRTSSASPALIAHLHSLIKLDMHVDPDTALFNSLMGAYSRVGAFTSAFRIWDTMRANHSIDHVSVSTVLDTCGYAKDERRARRTWKELQKEGFALNLKNWETWVECLERLGDFREAERVVFEDMKPGKGKVGAGVTTMETLLRFSYRFSKREKGRFEIVKARIKKDRPDLWEAVKDFEGDEDVGSRTMKVGTESGATTARF
ncbi:hypothetical protein P7C70_g1410, partial [Phenoliferia sp. Uapishka_3]